jgi:hypothetical protein
LAEGVIVEYRYEPDEFISPIFLHPKPDGSHRLILNMKSLNTYVHKAFKASQHQKYLTFVCKGTLYNFTCLPNGLASCPRKFTKLLKPVYSSLRQQGHVSSPYIDDFILIGDDYDECADNV